MPPVKLEFFKDSTIISVKLYENSLSRVNQHSEVALVMIDVKLVIRFPLCGLCIKQAVKLVRTILGWEADDREVVQLSSIHQLRIGPPSTELPHSSTIFSKFLKPWVFLGCKPLTNDRLWSFDYINHLLVGIQQSFISYLSMLLLAAKYLQRDASRSTISVHFYFNFEEALRLQICSDGSFTELFDFLEENFFTAKMFLV